MGRRRSLDKLKKEFLAAASGVAKSAHEAAVEAGVEAFNRALQDEEVDEDEAEEVIYDQIDGSHFVIDTDVANMVAAGASYDSDAQAAAEEFLADIGSHFSEIPTLSDYLSHYTYGWMHHVARVKFEELKKAWEEEQEAEPGLAPARRRNPSASYLPPGDAVPHYKRHDGVMRSLKRNEELLEMADLSPFDAEEIREWAEFWADNGFDARSFRPWQELGFGPGEALTAIEHGLTPTQLGMDYKGDTLASQLTGNRPKLGWPKAVEIIRREGV